MADKISQESPLYVEKEVHLLDYLHVVQRRWRIALIVFVLVFAGVAIRTFLQTPIYQASAVMRVGYTSEASQEVLRLKRENRFSIDSEIQVLTSYGTAARAADRLSLDWQLQNPSKGLDIHLRELHLPSAPDRLELVLTGPQRYELRTPAGELLLTGTAGEVSGSDTTRAEVVIHQGRAGDRVSLVHLGREGAIGRVLSGMSASEFGEGTNMLRLSVRKPDPMLAADIANALARAYYEQSRENKAEEATMMLEFVERQLSELGQDLDRSEQALQEFRIRTGLERLSPEGQSMIDAAVDLEKQRAELSLQRERIQRFLAESGRQSDDFAAVANLPGIGDSVQQLLELRAARADLLRRYTASHPSVVEVTDQIRQLREKIVASARIALRRLDQQLTDLEAQLRQSSARLEQVPEEELELVRLTRANQVNAELYSYLLQRQQEARIMAASTTGNVEIINLAQVPGAPVYPNTRKNLALGFILGAMLGVGLTFLLDYLDRTIKDEDDVQDKLGLPVLGTVPRIQAAEEGGDEHQLVTHLDPMSAPSEAFIALRTNLLYLLTNEKHRTVMLTSCLPGEGKSTVAVNLATTLASTGARTLLVGCDLRRPSLYKALDQTDAPGVTDLLMTGDPKAVRRIQALNLDFLPGGTEPPNPTQLLNGDRFRELLARFREDYDYVVIDVPPLLPVADALILASMVDINLMVIESCRIPEKIARRALRALQHHGAVLAGVVLNDKTGKGAKYYGAYSYYEGKYYQGYYRRDEPTPQIPAWRRVLGSVWEFMNR